MRTVLGSDLSEVHPSPNTRQNVVFEKLLGFQIDPQLLLGQGN